MAKARRSGINAAAWFYGQPGFHGYTVEIPATQAVVSAVVDALHRKSCGGTCEGCREQDIAKAKAARLAEERAADRVTGVR